MVIRDINLTKLLINTPNTSGQTASSKCQIDIVFVMKNVAMPIAPQIIKMILSVLKNFLIRPLRFLINNLAVFK